MNKFNAAILAIVLLASALGAHAQNGPRAYVHASAVYVFPGDDFDNAPGAALAAGVTFAKNHSIELEFIQFETESEANWGDHTNVTFQPMLMTYKYSFPVGKKLRIFAGLSAGLTRVKYETLYSYYIYNYPYDVTSLRLRRTDSDTVPAGGLQVGCAYEFTPRSAITLGTRLLITHKTDVTTSSGYVMLQLGYKLTF